MTNALPDPSATLAVPATRTRHVTPLSSRKGEAVEIRLFSTVQDLPAQTPSMTMRLYSVSIHRIRKSGSIAGKNFVGILRSRRGKNFFPVFSAVDGQCLNSRIYLSTVDWVNRRFSSGVANKSSMARVKFACKVTSLNPGALAGKFRAPTLPKSLI